MFKLTLLLLLALFITISSAYAADRTWTTQETLPDGNKIILYWTSVYEGRDTIYQVKAGDILIHLDKKKATGQPVLNLAHYLIALPYCADDGCQAKVNVLDLSKKEILTPIELNYKGQFYIICRWVGTILEIQFEPTEWTDPKDHKRILKYNVSSKDIVLYSN